MLLKKFERIIDFEFICYWKIALLSENSFLSYYFFVHYEFSKGFPFLLKLFHYQSIIYEKRGIRLKINFLQVLQ